MPCNDLHRMSLVVVVFLVVELISVHRINVEDCSTCGNTWSSCSSCIITWSCWIACGNTVLEDRLKNLSLDLLSPLLWK